VLWAVRHFYLVNHIEMLKKEIIINYYMEDFEYYGLVLTSESKNKLARWLYLHGYSPRRFLEI
jgi:hypothetical protein